ncbi:Amino acid transporter transmembrane [Penicillium samsonianum]|uniref:Amino acid transporter transmembrane n=1 Tax=Penicillium samsonianum TaxID=1882272 RepID=UPI002547DD82|nr:Amino acid transporter transmembrane [Penicillium samsonianum]KAJ6142632.1 Amino acid transporter transmembrane [Penicillium samsonianum]
MLQQNRFTSASLLALTGCTKETGSLWGSWVGIAFGLWVIAWIIAEAIPVFNNLLSFNTALFGSWFTFGFTGMFWLHMNKELWFSSPKKIMLTLLNTFAICVGITLCVLGLYASGSAIHNNPGSSSFSCASNTA